MRTRTVTVRIALALGLVSVAPPALAYLDPSTGSMIISAIIGLFATLGLAAKTYWYRLKSLFTGKRRMNAATAESPPRED